MSASAAAHGHGFLLVLLAFFLSTNIAIPFKYAEGKQTAYACEGTILRLDCEPGKVIHLIRAIYGRFSITICNENGNTEWSVNCGSPKSILVLNGTCNYQRTCSVMASTKTFGDPCPGTVKYLEVQYQCIPASSLTSTTPRSVLGGNRPGPPWLPSHPFGGGSSSESKSNGGKSPGSNNNNANEEPLPPDIVPYDASMFGNLSKYGHPDFPHQNPLLPPSIENESPSGVGVVATTGLPPSSSTSASSNNAVLLGEMNPLLPPVGSSLDQNEMNGGGDLDEGDDDMDEDDLLGETNDKTWGEMGNGKEGDATESVWKDLERDSNGKGEGSSDGGVDSMWSDKGDSRGGAVGGNKNNQYGLGGGMSESSNNGLGPVRGVITVTPNLSATQRTHNNPNGPLDPNNEGDSSLNERNHRYNSARGDVATQKRYCESKMDRGMFWNWTLVGEVAKQPCPGGASGLARWKCEGSEGSDSPSWFPDSPDLSDCKSAWLLSLQARVLEGDRISNVASDLAQVTSTKQMYGGDIAAAVRIIKTIATRMNDQLRTLTNQVSREDLAAELLGLILEAGSNLLEKTRLDPWRDLSYADQMKIATDLLVGLEDNAFLLANVVTSEKTLRKSVKNILTTIYAIEANNVREINFPSESSDHWGRSGDVLTMPAEALRENSDGGLVRLVCFAYNNLEHVLQPISPERGVVEMGGVVGGSGGSPERRKLVNSRVISASLNQGRHIQLALPVTLTLRHLWLDNVSNPQCVFWDYTQDKWSEEGCRVVKTNRTHTMCQCTHLTNFAILMDLEPPPKHLPTPKLLQVVMYVCSAVVILCLALTILITHFCIHGKVFQTMILKNLFFCMLMGELIFMFGVNQTDSSFGCTCIAIILHFFALASILWLFLHGFHLHLIVMEAAESGLSRQLWYYGVSYGSPAIVVLLSFLLDPRSYRSEEFCWIQTSFALLCFVGPAILVALATAAMIIYTSYKVSGHISTMPKKPNDDRALYIYVSTWLRGSLLILFLMILSWALRLLDLESDSPSLSYASSISLAVEGIVILVFHFLKAEDMISKICDCGKSSDTSDTEMSTHSQQGLQGGGQIGNSTLQPGSGLGGIGGGVGGGMLSEPCHNNHHLTAQRLPDSARLLTLSRQQTIDMRNHDGIYAKQLAAAVGAHPSPGFGDFGAGGVPPGLGHRYAGDGGGILGLYGSKGGGMGMDGSWTRGSSYSDIRSVGGGFHRNDPVYEEIEKPNHLSPRASVSDLSEDEGQIYPHDIDIYHRNIYGQNTRSLSHYHPHMHGSKRKGDILQGGEAANPLLSSLSRGIGGNGVLLHQQSQQQHPPTSQSQTHYSTRHRNHSSSQDHHQHPPHHHQISLKGLHPDDQHILQNVHMV